MNAIVSKADDRLQVMDVPSRGTAITPYDMVTQAVASGASLEVVKQLLDLHERWEAIQARKAFDAALADFKAENKPIAKNRVVDFTSAKGRTNYRHEDMGEIAKTIDPVLGRFGLSYRYELEQTPEKITVTCVLSHRDGHATRTPLSGAHDNSGNKNSIQAIASTITYLQRYSLKAALGLAVSNDDDGRKSEQTIEEFKTLSPEQVKAVEDKINEVDGSTIRLLKKAGVASLEEIPVADFAPIMQALAELGERKAKEQTNG